MVFIIPHILRRLHRRDERRGGGAGREREERGEDGKKTWRTKKG